MRGSLHGSVVRAPGLDPVVGAYLRIVRAKPPPASHHGMRSRVTDGRGTFAVDELEAGDWVVTLDVDDERHVRHMHVSDHAVSEMQFELDATSAECSDDGIRIPSAPGSGGGEVRGRCIEAASGDPIGDATVVVVVGAGPLMDIAPLTDADGNFAFDGLAPGRWRFRALTTDGRHGEAEVEVLTGTSASLTIEIATH